MALTGIKKVPLPATPGVDYSGHLGTPDNKVMAKPVISMVTTTKSVKSVEQHTPVESTTEHPGLFQDHFSPMAICVEGGRTMNLGNYESVKIGVTITVPCEPGTLEDAYEFATTWISNKISEAVKVAKGE